MELHWAALRGDVRGVKRQLALGTPVDAKSADFWGRNALMLAAGSDKANVSLLEFLILKGADPNAISDVDTLGFKRDETPFYCATVSGNVEKMRYLLSAGANPFNGAGASKEIACTFPIEVLDYQLELGFDPTVFGTSGFSAVTAAARDCDFSTLKHFMESGISMDDLDWTPLMRAIVFESVENVVQHLAQGADLNGVDYWARTPFLLSICSGDLKKAKLLLDADSILSGAPETRESAMECAILSQSLEMVSWLLSLKTDVNKLSVHNETPLMFAARKKNSKAVKVLLENGALVTTANEFDEQAINMATDVATIRLLASAGADINYIDNTGSFPLMVAVEDRSIETVKCLIELGADIDNRSYGMAALHQAVNYGELEIMQLLLSAGADPNLPGEDGLQPLWYSASHESTRILAEAGAISCRTELFEFN